MSLLLRTRQVRLAGFYEELMTKLLAHELASTGAPQPGQKAMTPSQAYEDAIQEADMQQLVHDTVSKLGPRGPKEAEGLAAAVAEDVNWHSLRILQPQSGDLGDLVSHISSELGYSVDSGALFITALLRSYGLTQKAEAVKREALQQFPESFEDLGPMRVANRYWKAQRSL
jgi:hypothetical protein